MSKKKCKRRKPNTMGLQVYNIQRQLKMLRKQLDSVRCYIQEQRQKETEERELWI